MKTMILCLSSFFLTLTTISAQTTATWIGGTPGKPNDWNTPYNWSEGRVPDENAQVIIPSDRQYYPVIISCLLYTSDAADERSSVDLGGRRIIKKKKHR